MAPLWYTTLHSTHYSIHLLSVLGLLRTVDYLVQYSIVPVITLLHSTMKSTKVQTLGRNIGTFGLETNLHAYVLGIYRTSFQHNLHCFIDACVHVVNDYIVSN